MNVDENHPSQDDVNLETEIGNEEVTENEEQASSENEEALEEAPQNEEDNSDATEQETPEEEQQPRKKSRVSDRIQKLNAQKKEALLRAERAEQQLKQFQEISSSNKKEYDEYDEYDPQSIARRAAKEAALEAAELTQQQSVTIAKQDAENFKQQEQNAKVQAFYEAEAEFSAKVPDYNETVSQVGFLAENDAVAQMILDSEKSAEVTYYLGKNPNEALAVAQMPPLEAARFIGRVEAKITPPTPKTTTAAPKPVPKISGKSGSQSKDPSKMSMKEYEKWRMGNS